MELAYTIKKRRGYWRPELTVTMTKNQWEVDLNIPGGPTSVDITIGWPDGQRGPSLNDSGSDSTATRQVRLPTSRDQGTLQQYVLPWKPGARPAYPEVAEVLQAVMAEWERRVLVALESADFEQSAEIEHSAAFRAAAAPIVAAIKMLPREGG